MNKMRSVFAALTLAILGAYLVLSQNAMSFFITSSGPANGANLGGLAGADRHCQDLAAAVGAGNRTWRAYLSTTASGGQAAVFRDATHPLSSRQVGGVTCDNPLGLSSLIGIVGFIPG
jgi:hypothetical protein